MRGFRASRAIQNFKSARFGHNDKAPFKTENGSFAGGESESQQKVKQLPEWLRMPEPKKAVVKEAAHAKRERAHDTRATSIKTAKATTKAVRKKAA